MLVAMHQITKRFGAVTANDHVDFALAPGEVHALLGENGAGKSTLMSVLTGLYRPDEGWLEMAGKRVQFDAPREAIQAGIGMVHQHFKLVAPFTVVENVLLGLSQRGIGLNTRQVASEVRAVSERYGLKVDPEARIWQLSVGEQQRVEIVKLLYRGARVLILDEPTAVLTPQEAQELFRILRLLAERGHGIIIITHKLHEVMGVSDRCTVLRDGKLVGTVKTSETSPRELTRMMLGRELPVQRVKPSVTQGPVCLQLSDLVVAGDRGTPALKGVNLAVRGGEILGIAGVAGNGQRELAEAVAGLRPAVSGRVDVTGHLAYIPEDRLGMGLVPNLSVADNGILRAYRKAPVARGPLLSRAAVQSFTAALVERFAVKTAGLSKPIRLLSGGNQQKLLVGRELATDPQVIVAAQPVRGLDVAATEAVHDMLQQARQDGKAVLLISEDLDELLSLADRIAVLSEGRVMGVVAADPAAMAQIGLMMAGRSLNETEEAATCG
ncbi:MAG: ABC transporter ATP-binding protein [Mycobacterium leprae]